MRRTDRRRSTIRWKGRSLPRAESRWSAAEPTSRRRNVESEVSTAKISGGHEPPRSLVRPPCAPLQVSSPRRRRGLPPRRLRFQPRRDPLLHDDREIAATVGEIGTSTLSGDPPQEATPPRPPPVAGKNLVNPGVGSCMPPFMKHNPSRRLARPQGAAREGVWLRRLGSGRAGSKGPSSRLGLGWRIAGALSPA